MIGKLLKSFFNSCCNLQLLPLWISVLVLLLLGFAIWRRKKEKVRIEFLSETKCIILLGSIAVVILFLISFLFSKISCDELVSSSPGVIFLLVIATITICGFWVTLRKIRRLIPTIFGFEEVLKEATEMIEEVVDDYKKSKHKYPRGFYIKMVCFTPSHGNLSARRAYKAYEDEIKGFAKSYDLEICCLDPEGELEFFYGGYIGRFKGQEDLVIAAYKEAIMFLGKLKSESNVKIHIQKRSLLPTYHFILSPRKALVFIPFSIPPPGEIASEMLDHDNENEDQIKIPDDLTEGGVKMLAIQSEESHILSYLEDAFNFYRDVRGDSDPLVK